MVVASDAVSIAGPVWSPDSRRLAFAAGARGVRHEQTPEYSGAKIVYTVTERVPGRGVIVDAGGGRAVAIREGTGAGLRWLGNERLVFDRVSSDFRRRGTFVVDAATGAVRLLREDVDDKFWSIPGNAGGAALPSPDGRWIAFLSDRDGWDHLYVMAAAGGEPVQVTRGDFEAWRPAWSPDSTRIAFDANRPGEPGTPDRHRHGQRHHGPERRSRLDHQRPRHPRRARVVTRRHAARLPAHRRPDLGRLVRRRRDRREATRLSASLPAPIAEAPLVEPEFVTYPGRMARRCRGGCSCRPGSIGPGGTRRSSGSTETASARTTTAGTSSGTTPSTTRFTSTAAAGLRRLRAGLSRQHRLRARLAPGRLHGRRRARRAGRVDGGHLPQSLPYVDGDRLGVWGLSYGGFFTLIAMTDQPTLFRAGVDVAGVVDYWICRGPLPRRLDGQPDRHAGGASRRLPPGLTAVARRALTRPLLVLHGTADVSVPSALGPAGG